jgi:uncharacterized RDD family membrane protein YckC
MKHKFQLGAKGIPADSVLVDPDAYDASEQQFAASLEGASPRFVVSEPGESPRSPVATNLASADKEIAPAESAEQVAPTLPPELQNVTPAQIAGTVFAPEDQPNFLSPPDTPSWRTEVSDRLDRYRSKRRPKEPRYPSLRLEFDSTEPAWSAPAPPCKATEVARVAPAPSEAIRPQTSDIDHSTNAGTGDATARIIPFRRASAAPPRPLEELAEPVLIAPRILEATEVAPPQPALGGISIEPAAEEKPDKRPGIEVPLQPAAMFRRVLATVTDIVVVLIAEALFGYIFLRTAGCTPSPQQAIGIALLLAGILWPSYQYALVVYGGTTPGLKLAKLRLSRFDGNSVPRSLRRWRVLASVLSGVSLGLGYAWCILDEDQLCWHDRITETYMAPVN